MNLNYLLSIAVLAEERHFVRAAARLGISQSALTQQVQRIERELGLTLFSRTQRQVVITEAGKAFVEEARRVLTQYDIAIDAARRASKGEIGKLRLGFVENAALHLLPRTVSRFRRHHPHVRLELNELISAQLVQALQEETLDAALMRPIAGLDALKTMTLLREPYQVALPADHPLAQKTAIAFADIVTDGMIIAPAKKSTYLLSVFRPLCERHNVEFTIAQEVEQLHAIIGLVGAGLGYTLLPRSAAALSIEGVVYRPLADPEAPQAELVLAWSANATNPVLNNFLAVARDASRQ
ncbi:LysR family transcriptional regulator [Kushneria indalinina]|uniref:LysR family transcriptional regulator n=1 Tax=Kushneria indalinina TaxID=184067 RepID=UPI0011C026F0|nr:LysR family transcriptional regulator [Kushneria indalinina]